MLVLIPRWKINTGVEVRGREQKGKHCYCPRSKHGKVNTSVQTSECELLLILLPLNLYNTNHKVMLDASSSPDVGFKPICADMGAEGARQTLWQWYNWCKIDELESLQVWDTSDDTSLFRLTLELLHKFKEYNVKILLQSWDSAKV